MNTAMTTLRKYITMALLLAWGMVSFLALCAEDAPGQVTSLRTLVLVKLCALISLVAACRAILRAERRRGLPDFWYTNDDNRL